jgi:hypothetical protein
MRNAPLLLTSSVSDPSKYDGSEAFRLFCYSLCTGFCVWMDCYRGLRKGPSPAKVLLHTAASQLFRSVTFLFFNNDQLHQYMALVLHLRNKSLIRPLSYLLLAMLGACLLVEDHSSYLFVPRCN